MTRSQARFSASDAEHDRVRALFAYWFFRLSTALAPRLPERFGYWVCSVAGALAFYVARGPRTRYLKNINHVVGSEVTASARTRLARRALQNLCKNYFDLFRGPRLSREHIRSQLESLEGYEYIEQALARNKGMIGGSAHFGNFNLFLHLAAVYLQEKREVIVPIERLNPPAAYEYTRRLRASQGITIIPVDTAPRTLVKSLRSGQIIGLALDYDVLGTGLLVDFFGSPARIPDGAVVLALKYDAPLILAFIRRLDDNRSAVVVEPPLELKRTGNTEQDVREGVQQIVGLFEKWIRRYPDQWLMFQPIWEEDKR